MGLRPRGRESSAPTIESKTAAHFETVDALSFVLQRRLKCLALKMCTSRLEQRAIAGDVH
jgi:hypothetical protein